MKPGAFAIDFLRNHEKIRLKIRNFLRWVGKKKYIKETKNIDPDKQTVYFSSFDGRSFSDSPRAIYNYMLNSKEFEHYTFIWSFIEPEKYKWLLENHNTYIVQTGTKEEMRSVAKAGYWITNYKLPDSFWPFDNQVYVQCWHGTPLKKLGLDLKKSNNAMNSIKEIKERYMYDAKRFSKLVSPSPFTTRIFTSVWGITDPEDVIIEEGYPRNDLFFDYKIEKLSSIKESLRITEDKKVVLYAPTWRDDQYKDGIGYMYEMALDLNKLSKQLGDDYVILCRFHYLVSERVDYGNYQDAIINVSDFDDVNDLLLITDILITDYSSIFFDYANLKRPMIFFMYDYEQYKNELHDFYIDVEELPGEIIFDSDHLADTIKRMTFDFVADDKYLMFNKTYNCKDDGNATARTVEEIFLRNER